MPANSRIVYGTGLRRVCSLKSARDTFMKRVSYPPEMGREFPKLLQCADVMFRLAIVASSNNYTHLTWLLLSEIKQLTRHNLK